MKNFINRIVEKNDHEENPRQFSFNSNQMEDLKKQEDPNDYYQAQKLDDAFRRYSFDDNGGGYQGL